MTELIKFATVLKRIDDTFDPTILLDTSQPMKIGKKTPGFYKISLPRTPLHVQCKEVRLIHLRVWYGAY